jgi:hypothetical protein
MSKFLGGSAFAMARDIGAGYHLVTERTFKGMQRSEVEQLRQELDKQLREARGSQVSLDDMNAVKARNRRIQRLNTAMMILRTYQQQQSKRR